MDNQNLFSQTYNQLIASALKGSGGKFQMLGNPINFSWPVAAQGQESPMAYQIMSSKPKYQEVGNFDFGDASFFDCYKQVMNLLTFKVSPEKQNDLQNAKDELTNAQNSMSTILSNATSDYNTQLQNTGSDAMTALYGGSDFGSFLKNSSYAQDYKNAKAAYDVKSTFYYSLVSNLTTDSTLQNIMKAIQTPTGAIGTSAAPAGWTKVPNSDGTLEWQPIYNIATSGQGWRAKLTAGNAGGFTVNLDASKADSSYDKSWAGGSTGSDFGFWAFGGSGGWEKTNISQSDSSITVQVSAQASTVVPITPGSWYDGGFMQKLARNTANTGYTLQQGWDINGGPGSNSVFGQYGLLSCRVNALVVAYKLSYKITMKTSTYTMYHEKFEASGGLRIGPFTIGGSGGHESTVTHQTSDNTTIEGTDTSDDPQIIGVLVAFPGLDEA